MGNIWFTSDTHFGHTNILGFKKPDETLLRPGFNTVEHMDETIIENWNREVKVGDKIYHLGDVAICSNLRMANILGRLSGRKRLAVGNHDELKGTPILKYFQKVSFWRIFKEHNFLCAHVPLREEQFRMVDYQVHGHIHAAIIGKPYINVCVETRNYTPVHLDTILAEIRGM